MCKVCPMTDAANGKGIQGNDRPSPHKHAVSANTMKPHIHADTIKAWADGAEIELKVGPGSNWQPTNKPAWVDCYEYRVKPTPVPLWAVAHDAFFRHPEHLDKKRSDKWEAVADAVVKAYEERGRVA